MIKTIGSRLFKLVVLSSQTANVLLFDGHEDQTISSCCYERRNDPRWSKGYKFLNILFFLLIGQDDHCRDSWLRNKIRAEELLYKLQ